MNFKTALHFLSFALGLSSPAWAQVGNAPQTPAGAPLGGLGSSAAEMESPSYQLKVGYGFGLMGLEVKGSRTLTKVPDPAAYGEEEAVEGSYAGGGIRQLRTVAAIAFPREHRTYTLGLGLDNLEAGSAAQPMLRSGGTQGQLQLTSLVIEGGVQRLLDQWGFILLAISYDHGLFGKLQSRYLSPGAQTGSPVFATITDEVASSARLTLGASYQFNLAPGCSMGLAVNALYGVIRFKERSEPAHLYGSSLGLTLLLKI